MSSKIDKINEKFTELSFLRDIFVVKLVNEDNNYDLLKPNKMMSI